MPDSTDRSDSPKNPPKEWNEGQEVHLHWGKDGKGRPGLNQRAEEELEETAEPTGGSSEADDERRAG